MIKTKSKCGYIVYKVTAFEVMRLGGIGVCDECNCAALHGYLIPVLNHYMCQDCYNDWNEQATYYEEDIPHEQRTSEYYEKMIPKHKGGSSSKTNGDDFNETGQRKTKCVNVNTDKVNPCTDK